MRDLRRLGPGPEVQRVLAALQALSDEKPNLDVKALQGRPPWLRLRVGDYRVLYRPVFESADQQAAPDPTGHGAIPELRYWVERVVHRGALEQAVGTL